MNQLAVFLPESQALPALADAELEKATATRTAYRSDFAIFAASALPALPSRYRPRWPSWRLSLRQRRTPTPRRPPSPAVPPRSATRTGSPGTSRPPAPRQSGPSMRGIRRSIGAAKDQKAPATADLTGRPRVA
jgi:hypothetical protein